MHAVEFRAYIKDGIIIVPEAYRKSLTKNVKVIVLSEEEENRTSDRIEALLNSPLKVYDFKPMTREAIYERR